MDRPTSPEPAQAWRAGHEEQNDLARRLGRYQAAHGPTLFVMAALVAAIHDFLSLRYGKSWMAGLRRAMTVERPSAYVRWYDSIA